MTLDIAKRHPESFARFSVTGAGMAAAAVPQVGAGLTANLATPAPPPANATPRVPRR
jgi:hypothetical protein